MSETNDLFAETKTNTPETPVEPQADPFADKLQEIRNESGEPKYRDVETALDALKNSQQFIAQLKQEKRELEERYNTAQSELEKMGTIDDYVNKLKPQTAANAEPPKETPKAEVGLSEERVAQLLEERLSAREKANIQAANLEKVVGTVTQTHGEGAAEFIKQRALELDTTPQELKELAMRNPSVALTLLGGTPSKPTTPTQSTVIPPRQAPDDNPRPEFKRSVVHGGITNKELTEMWKQSRDYTHKRLGVKT